MSSLKSLVGVISSNDTDTNVCQCPNSKDITVNYRFPVFGPNEYCNVPKGSPYPFQNHDGSSYQIQNIPSACERSNVKMELQAFQGGTNLTGENNPPGTNCKSYWTS